MKIYLDLDRTLLDTAKIAAWIWAEIGARYGLDPDEEYALVDSYYVNQPGTDMYYYDLARHLTERGVDPAEAAELLATHPAATDNRFLMPGAAELVARLEAAGHVPEILTFGDDYYQGLKLRLCPALRHLRAHITTQPKSFFLEDKGECVLVDDKKMFGELPGNVQFIWVQIEGEAKSIEDPRALTSLAAVGGALGV